MFRQVVHYQTQDGKIPFQEWLLSLKDATIRNRILARIDRLLRGSFGDSKNIGNSVFELRFHFGAGIRVYFGLDGSHIILLLCAGDKSSQQKDIKNAKIYWRDYLRRNYESSG